MEITSTFNFETVQNPNTNFWGKFSTHKNVAPKLNAWGAKIRRGGVLEAPSLGSHRVNIRSLQSLLIDNLNKSISS